MTELKKVVMIAQVSATGASGKSPLLPPSGSSWDSRTGAVIWKRAFLRRLGNERKTKLGCCYGKPHGPEEGIKVRHIDAYQRGLFRFLWRLEPKE